MAQAFPMKDGKMPGDPSSEYSYDLQTFWENRDPRYAANLVWNGAVYELSGKSGRRQYTMENIAASVDAFGLTIQGESVNGHAPEEVTPEDTDQAAGYELLP